MRCPTPDVALANHLVMGPVILARALAGACPYAVKVHGSALEYTVRPHPERFLPYALEGIRGANGVLVGSSHTAESLFEVLGDEPSLRRAHAPRPARRGRAQLPPPRARPRADRRREPAAAWGGEQGTAEVLRTLDPSRDRIVSYVGKLIVSKGVDLLLAAWPLVVGRVPDARLLMVGFGTYRDALDRFVDALRRADVDALREIAARGPRARGRAGRRAALPERVPRHGRRGLAARRPGRRRAHPLHGPPRARRPARTCCPRARRR